jgi:hypothetical protein
MPNPLTKNKEIHITIQNENTEAYLLKTKNMIL